MDYDKYQNKLQRLKKKVQEGGITELVACSSCKDEYPVLISRKLTGDKCPECYAEMNFGIISRKPADLGFFGSPGVREETSNSWENVVKSLEERTE